MKPSDLFRMHRAALREAEEKGVTTVSTATLHRIFDDMEQDISQLEAADVEGRQAFLARQLAHDDAMNKWHLEQFKQVISLGQSAMKGAMLINAGAAVALLAFLGNMVASADGRFDILAIAGALRSFVFGVFLAAMAFATTYASQAFCSSESPFWRGWGIGFHAITVLIGIGALIVFFIGAEAAYQAFVETASHP